MQMPDNYIILLVAGLSGNGSIYKYLFEFGKLRRNHIPLNCRRIVDVNLIYF